MAIDKRIVDLIKRKPRRWNKKLKLLRVIRRRVLELPLPDKIVKGWKGEKRRRERMIKMRGLRRSRGLSYREIGHKFGMSRQRVHQIINSPEWR